MDQQKVGWAGTGTVKLPFVEQGTGDLVVLVHGSNSDLRIWNRHRPILASRYRVVSPSQRYFGEAPWLDDGGQFSLSVLADDLASFVRGLDAVSVTLVGWSFGGAVSMVMAVRNPAMIRQMFLYEPSLSTFVTERTQADTVARDRMAQSVEARRFAAGGDLAGAVRALMDGVNGTEGSFDRLRSDVQAIMIDNARMLPLMFAAPAPPAIGADDLRALRFPVTICVGKKSRANYRITASVAHRLLPNARLVEVEGARHLWPVEEPESFSGIVLDCLKER